VRRESEDQARRDREEQERLAMEEAERQEQRQADEIARVAREERERLEREAAERELEERRARAEEEQRRIREAQERAQKKAEDEAADLEREEQEREERKRKLKEIQERSARRNADGDLPKRMAARAKSTASLLPDDDFFDSENGLTEAEKKKKRQRSTNRYMELQRLAAKARRMAEDETTPEAALEEIDAQMIAEMGDVDQKRQASIDQMIMLRGILQKRERDHTQTAAMAMATKRQSLQMNHNRREIQDSLLIDPGGREPTDREGDDMETDSRHRSTLPRPLVACSASTPAIRRVFKIKDCDKVAELLLAEIRAVQNDIMILKLRARTGHIAEVLNS
jgi:trichohyalin